MRDKLRKILPAHFIMAAMMPISAIASGDVYSQAVENWNANLPQLLQQSQSDQTSQSSSVFNYEQLSKQLFDVEVAYLDFHLKSLGGARPQNNSETLSSDQLFAQQFQQLRALQPQPKVAKTNPVAQPEQAQLTLTQAATIPSSDSTTDADNSSEKSEALRSPTEIRQHAHSSAVTYVEAFDIDEPELSVQTRALSHVTDFSDKSTRGWSTAFAPYHWPTLSWHDSRNAKEKVMTNLVPMISSNSVSLISAMTGAVFKQDSGIVFGKVSAGWTVEFSGQSAQPLYLSMTMDRLDPDDAVNHDRYFIFADADQGANFVHLQSSTTHEVVGIAIPVLSATATFLDLTHIVRSSASGFVLSEYDDGSDELYLTEKAVVRVVGQSEKAGLTDENGQFRFDNVLCVGSYPIFLETDHSNGDTHRYQSSPYRLMDLTLYRKSAQQVQEWNSQLAGGINSQSGLIVAAVPELVRHNPDATLRPTVTPIASTTPSPLVPETYTLLPQGDFTDEDSPAGDENSQIGISHGKKTGQTSLQVGDPLGAYETRFVGVQIPPGLVVAQVDNQNNQMVSGELTVASPGVITMVGDSF